jgi:hypothetical protein
MHLRRCAVLATIATWAAGCNAAGPGTAGIPAPEPSYIPSDTQAPGSSPFDRLEPHDDIVIPNIELRAVYVGTSGNDAAPNRDAFLSWVVTSPEYWGILAQYGVGYGTFHGSEEIATDAFFPEEVQSSGIVEENQLNEIIYAYLGSPLPGAGFGESTTGFASLAYVFFFPSTVSIVSSGGQESCVTFGGYHWTRGPGPPYAVIPSCLTDLPFVPISHELLEMATDPTEAGWYSNADFDNAGGEIADICNAPVSVPINLLRPTRMWSNAAGSCVP